VPAEQLRERYNQILFDRVAEARYPSAPMLDRVEAGIVDLEAAEEYVDLLLDTVGQDRYPSPQLLDRLNRLIGLIEAASASGNGRR
jgi:hypothetical protein